MSFRVAKALLLTLEFGTGAAAILVAHLYLWPKGNYLMGLCVDIMGVTFTAMGVASARRLR